MLHRTDDSFKNKMPQISLHLESISPLKKANIQPQISGTRSNGILSRIILHYGNRGIPLDQDLKNLRKEMRQKVRWSEDEQIALLDGVDCFGFGKWTEILKNYKGIFKPTRRVVDLVNKYKQCSKSTSFYKTPKKTWVELDENLNPKKDALGEFISYSEKFPYVAALNFVKKLKITSQQPSKIIIQNADDTSNIHMYKFSIENGKIKLQKLVFK